MLNFLDRAPYSLLIIVSIFMLLAPFYPMPHALEKIIMLKQGTLKRPLDIFDLVFHIAPALMLAAKWLRSMT